MMEVKLWIMKPAPKRKTKIINASKKMVLEMKYFQYHLFVFCTFHSSDFQTFYTRCNGIYATICIKVLHFPLKFAPMGARFLL